jgi:uncharacterized protein YggU (UPF0235/DUF167 family)
MHGYTISNCYFDTIRGKANEKLREIVAKALGVSKSRVEILRGETSRLKTLRILGITQGIFDSFMKKLTKP